MKKYMVLVFKASCCSYEWEIIENQNYADSIDTQAQQFLCSYLYSVSEIDIIYLTNAYKWQKQYSMCELLNAVPLNSLDDAIAYGTHRVNELTSQRVLSEIKV